MSCLDCAKPMQARGYCPLHYMRHKRLGEFEGVPKASQEGIRKNTGRTHFKKGTPAWNAGKTGWPSGEHRKALEPKWFKRGHEPWNKGQKRPEMAGENNPMWRGGVTTQNQQERVKFRKQTQKKVFERDNYTCQVCGQYSGSLQVDHIKSWADFPELRFELDNCRTVCMGCHYFITFKRKMPEGISWGHNLSRRIAS